MILSDPVYLTCFRLTPQSNCGGVMTTNPQLAVTPANPLAMPVFPLRPTPSPYSPYSPSRFHIDKRCQHRCSWKCCSIALILLSVALTAMLAYFGGDVDILNSPGLRVGGNFHCNYLPVRITV
uniref:Uncharacterized protein n=1 Tax=Timema monikensis TaxID=170555 RepID=A0A7R9HII9_9NEOP|nr:unnamed protein product [Timema monikensis]